MFFVKTNTKQQKALRETKVPGLSLYTKPQQEDVFKKKWPRATFFQRQEFQQTTTVPTDDNNFNR